MKVKHIHWTRGGDPWCSNVNITVDLKETLIINKPKSMPVEHIISISDS